MQSNQIDRATLFNFWSRMFVKHFNFVSLWLAAVVTDVTGGDQNDPGLVTEAAIITVTMGHQGPGHTIVTLATVPTTTTSAIISTDQENLSKGPFFSRALYARLLSRANIYRIQKSVTTVPSKPSSNLVAGDT